MDVDLQNGQWRIMHFNQTDQANEWLGKNPVKWRISSLSHNLPLLHPVSEKVARNGSFSQFEHNHVLIPDLNLGIQNLKPFLGSCSKEPFLRVFDTGKTNNHAELIQLMNREWNNKNEEDVLMRTASFGHKRQRLDMCMKERGVHLEDIVSSVADEELLVPLTIISALRLRAWETDFRTFDCDS